MNSSSSERSSSFLSSNHSYYEDSSSESDAPEINTAAYELYLKTKKERAELAKASIIDPNKKCRKLDIDSDFPNYKRKLVVQYIPSSQSEEEIMSYFYGILSQVSQDAYSKNPILAVEKGKYQDFGFVTLEFRKRDDAEHILNLDGTKYTGSMRVPMKIQRVKRFVAFWNDEVARGRNPAAEALGLKPKEGNFSLGHVKSGSNDQQIVEDHRVFMGGIPFSMHEEEVREMCESFGRLKNFNLIKDTQQAGLNKGYAFFEYIDDRAAEKAIKALNQLEIKDKRLKVQKASEGLQKSAVISAHRAVPDEKQLTIPQHCTTASRVVQFLNMIALEDLFFEAQIQQVKDDLLQECVAFGDIISIEIPRPSTAQIDSQLPGTSLVTYAHGKIFVKFNHIVSAKQARFNLSGRIYNNRTVIASFYPEHFYDIKEFSII